MLKLYSTSQSYLLIPLFYPIWGNTHSSMFSFFGSNWVPENTKPGTRPEKQETHCISIKTHGTAQFGINSFSSKSFSRAKMKAFSAILSSLLLATVAASTETSEKLIRDYVEQGIFRNHKFPRICRNFTKLCTYWWHYVSYYCD